MLDYSNNNQSIVGGTNDVSGTWDGTLNTSVSGAVTNMTLSSPTSFFQYRWTANNVQVFAPGTYTFTEGNGASQQLVVGRDQVGMHMMFSWGTGTTDVIDLWNLNNNYNGGSSTAFYSGPTTTADSWSGTNNHIWGLASNCTTSWPGTCGYPMQYGPFQGATDIFNLYNGTKVTPVPLPSNAWLFGTGLLSLVGLVGGKKRRR